MRGIAILVATILALGPLGAGAQDSNADKSTLTQFLESSLSSAGRQVEITGFRGALSSVASLDEMTFADDTGIWLTLRDVSLDWNRAALLTGRISINQLRAGQIVISRTPTTAAPQTTAEATPFRLPELPISVQIAQIEAGRVDLGAAILGEKVGLSIRGALTLGSGEGSADLAIARVDGVNGRMTLAGHFTNASRKLDLALNLAEPRGGIIARLANLPDTPAVDLTINGTGTLDDFKAQLTLDTDGERRLTGGVVLAGTSGFRADIEGDIAPLFAPDYQPFFGPNIALQTAGARRSDGGWDLSKFKLQAAELALSGQISLAASGVPQRFSLTGGILSKTGQPVVLPLPGQKTTLRRADISLAFDAAKGQNWTGQATVQDLSQPDMSVGTLALTGTGQIDTDTTPRISVHLNFDANALMLQDQGLNQALGPIVRGQADVLWVQDQPLQLEALRVTAQGLSAAAQGQMGDDTSAVAVIGTADLHFESLAHLETLTGQPLRGAANATLSGRFDPLSGGFDLSADVHTQDAAIGQEIVDRLLIGPVDLALSAKRDATGLELRAGQLSSDALSATFAGRLNSTNAALRSTVSFNDLGLIDPKLTGTFEARADLTTDDNGAQTLMINGTTQGLTLSGLLGQDNRLNPAMSEQADLAVLLRRTGDLITLERGQFRAGPASLQANGQMQAGVGQLTAVLDLGDLSVLGPDFDGNLTATADIITKIDAQFLTLSAQSNGLQLGPDLIDPTWATALEGPAQLSLSLVRRDKSVVLDHAQLSSALADVTAHGTYTPKVTTLAIGVARSDLTALGSGYGGQIRGDATLRQTGQTRHIKLSGTAQDIALNNPEITRLLAGETNFSADMAEKNGDIQIDAAAVENPQLSLNITGNHPRLGRQEAAGQKLTMTARLTDTALLAPEFPGPLSLNGAVTVSPSRTWIDLMAKGPGGIDASLRGGVAHDLSQADLAIKGTTQAALFNGLIEPRALRGPINFDLKLAGPLVPTAISGRITGTGLRAVSGFPGLVLADLGVSIDLADGQATLKANSGMSGGSGQVTLTGSLGLATPYPADLAIVLRKLGLRDPSLYTSVVNGKLAVRGPLAGGAVLSGRIDVGETQIQVPATLAAGLSEMPTITHLNEPKAVHTTRRRAGLLAETDANTRKRGPIYGLDLTIDAPRRIFIRGRGLDAELGGQIVVAGTSANVIPSGELRLIRGRLDILGKRLTLNQGTATLQGGFVPMILLEASTKSDAIVSTIRIEGPATDPTTSFTSQPPLPEEEVLARILFGHGLDSISAFQAAQMASSVATLSGRGGEGMVGKLRKAFALDDFDVTTDAAGNAELRFGKYLAKNIYTDVTLGQEGTTEVSINLDLSQSITLRGAVDSESKSGIGVFFERDY